MIDPNHHPSCATQIDSLRCTCEREQAWDAERQRQRAHVGPCDFTTEQGARDWLRFLICDAGISIHPDTYAAEYVCYQTGEFLFSGAECPLFDAAMDRVFTLIEDPYCACVDILAGRELVQNLEPTR